MFTGPLCDVTCQYISHLVHLVGCELGGEVRNCRRPSPQPPDEPQRPIQYRQNAGQLAAAVSMLGGAPYLESHAEHQSNDPIEDTVSAALHGASRSPG